MAAVRAAREAGLIGGRGPGSARLLRMFSEEQILADPSLTLFAGWIFALHWGTPAEQRLWGSRACRIEVDDSPSRMGASSLRSFQALLRAYLAPDGVTRMVRDAELCVKLETDPARGWYLLARSTLAIAFYLAGRSGPAAGMLAGSRGARAQGAGSCHRAQRALPSRRGRRRLGAGGGPRSPGDRGGSRAGEPGRGRGLPPPLLWARVPLPRALPTGRSRARRLSRGTRELPWTHDPPSRLHASVDGRRARRGLPRAGRCCRRSQWSDEALRILRRYPDAGILGPRARRLDEALQRRRHVDPLSPAERRVLELLQTHLTADQIAARLFVSTNTVRTHMRALHRKLGTTTRAETVATAVELGLLLPSH